jgi:hypothetical protein
MKKRLAFVAVAFLLFQALWIGAARAGTTGSIVGRVTDAVTKEPIANATVAIVSPSQSATTTTDAVGSFRFLSLAPDTYVLSVQRPGFDPVSVSGVTVAADQSQSLPVGLNKSLEQIGAIRARSVTDLIKPGTTSDVYSINAAGAEAAHALGGPGGLDNAYSAIASVPGVNVQQGQQGWFQTVSIRGGDIDQVGYELDGIPVNRVYDNAPQTMLSNIGQQELQVYTGGTPATADASGIAGYVNQVIRTGTYPGFANVNVGLGGPAFYHKLSFEAGGATKNRLFSYYVGFAGINEDYRYEDQFNGVSDKQQFYPVYFPEGHYNFWDGTPGSAGSLNFAPGSTYAISHTSDRENVANIHIGIPHHNDSGKDDVQLLYLTSEIVAHYFSSVTDQGGPANVANAVGNNGNAYYHDGYVYTGPLFGTPNVADIVTAPFPNANGHTLGGLVSNDAEDYGDNGVALAKIQYQRNFNPSSYLRMYGYTEYSNWFIGGPANQQFANYYGAELNDYELPSHTFGFNANYSNQLSDKHLLSVTGSYTAAQVQRRFGYGFPGNTTGYGFANYVGANGLCYDPTSGGVQVSCYSARASFPGDPPGTSAVPGDLTSISQLLATRAPAGSPAALAGAQWLATDNGYASNRLNRVSPAFSAVAATDQWRPNDRLTFTLGARLENYDDRLADTTNSPARQFWFNAYNNENCFKPGNSPQSISIGAPNPLYPNDPSKLITGTSPALCANLFGAGWLPANLVNAQAPHVSANVFEPRFGATYALGPDSVLRGSFGVYARPVNTSWVQYDAVNQDLASFIGGNFLGEGYNTPIHDLHPDTSYNADFSLEQHLKNTDVSFKLTPFYRATKNQLQPVPIGAGGVVSGFNVGQQTSTGVEFALKKGDFGRDGLAMQLAYTYTHSRIKYNNYPSGTNVIDNINQYIQNYNQYTSACAKITQANANLCGLAPGTANPNAVPTFTSTDSAGLPIRNPYYNSAAQPIFDRNGEYTTYDEIPQPFTGENGYETPNVASLILSYHHQRVTLTPSLTYSSGAKYGSPLAYPGYEPNSCQAKAGTQAANGTFAADPYTCSGSYLLIPDAFTGKYDNLGAFNEPQRLTLNFAASYQATKNVKFSVAVTGLVDSCFQRGYAWDDGHVCVYSQLASGGAGLGPSGNYIPIAQTPVQFRFPYAAFNNNLNTGFLGTTIPMDVTANMEIKL